MKRVLILMKKPISLLLVMSMFMTLSSTVFATVTTKNIAMEKLSAPLALNPLVEWGLKSLATGAVSAIGGKGINAAFAAIFGDDTTKIMSSLDDVNKNLSDINNKLGNLTKQLDDLKQNATNQNEINNLCDDLDTYNKFIRYYKFTYNLLNFPTHKNGDEP